MHRALTILTFVAFTLNLAGQTLGGSAAKTRTAAAGQSSATIPSTVKDLPVRKVVLYKNGVGYFEHSGTVSGNQHVSIDFTSSQLNDVLQSLTVLDEGGGHIAGVNYNSPTPLEEQLKTLAIGLKDFPPTIAVYQALRGQRVEVTGAGAPVTGRLVNIEFRKETDKNGATSEDHYFLIVATDAGALRTAELTDAVSVRMADAAVQKQFAYYLEIIAEGQNQEARHLTLDALGQGQRDLHVSYISEVPVWKSTYRMVFPRTANGTVTLQGWAVVDNTVGADWDNVQLSLVAGAPQSFIQPLSQPIYTRRLTIPISTQAQLAPQIHEAAEMAGNGALAGTVTDGSGAVIPNATVTATAMSTGATTTRVTNSQGGFNFGPLPPGQYTVTVSANGFQRYVQQNVSVNAQMASTVNAALAVGSSTASVTVDAAAPALAMETLENRSRQISGRGQGYGFGPGTGGNVGGGLYSAGGVYRASDALQQGDVSTSAFDDFFEYALTAPVTIHKNESAMVPILQQDLPAEHVTIWSEREARPLRAVWLENKSKLTLDSGSFSIFESGEFAGEGLLDPIHPGEKRLLSYAADQAVRVKVDSRESKNPLHHIKIEKGVIVETHMDVAGVTYSATNSADMDRVVLLEHPRHNNGWSLDEALKPAETSASFYRFRLPVAAHSTATLQVWERGPAYTTVTLNPNQDQTAYLLELVKTAPDALDKLKPVIDGEVAIADLDAKIVESNDDEEKATADEARDRDNLTALKGNDAAKRFVEELNQAEDALQAARKKTADLQQQKQTAVDKLSNLISGISWDWDVTGK
jgi:hypothetical protein